MLTREVAGVIPAPEPTLRYWRTIGYGPRYVKIGRRVFYLRDSVEQFRAQLFEQPSAAIA